MANTAADLLAAAKSWQETLRALYTDAIAVGLRVTAWAKGSPTRAVYYSVAKSFVPLTEMVRDTANQGFKATATKDALTLNVREVFGITRPGATYATTTIFISNEAGGNYAYSPDAPLFLLNTAKKKQYTSLGAGVIGPLASAVPVSIIAIEPGSESTALPDEVDAFVTPVDGLLISQPNAAIAVDSMSDEDLRAAADARVGFVPTESTIGAGGAPGAYESVVRAGPDGKGGVLRPNGTRIAVTRVRVMSDGAGGVIVVVADQDGPIATEDLALVDAAVKAYAHPTGAGVAAAQNSSTLNISIIYKVDIPGASSATDDEIKTAAEAAIIAYFQRVPIGGFERSPGVFTIPLDGIRRAIGNAIAQVVGDVVAVTVTTPAADLMPTSAQVPSLSGTPTATINRVPNV